MASGLFYNEDGDDVTMDVLSQAVEEMDVTEDGNCPKCGSANVSRHTGGVDNYDIAWPSCDDCAWIGQP